MRRAAIRPVPPYAQISREVLNAVEEQLGSSEAGGADSELDEGEPGAEQRLADAFERFELAQPALAERLGDALSKANDDVAMALGYYLSLVLWLSFDQAFGDRMMRVTTAALDGVEQELALDEELRGADPTEAIDSDDVVAMEQPHVLELLHEHVDAALEAHAADVDVDAVHAMYRRLLILLLALSYAVAPPEDFAGYPTEMRA